MNDLFSDGDTIWDKTVNQVEELIQRLYDHDYVVKTKDDLEKDIAYQLGKAIASYDHYRHAYPMRQSQAVSCKAAFDRAFAQGIIHPSDSLIRKQKECEEERAKVNEEKVRLQELNAKLKEDLAGCRGQLKEFERKYLPPDSSQNTTSFSGDVTDG